MYVRDIAMSILSRRDCSTAEVLSLFVVRIFPVPADASRSRKKEQKTHDVRGKRMRWASRRPHACREGITIESVPILSVWNNVSANDRAPSCVVAGGYTLVCHTETCFGGRFGTGWCERDQVYVCSWAKEKAKRILRTDFGVSFFSSIVPSRFRFSRRPPRFKIQNLENFLNPRLGGNVTPLEYDCTKDAGTKKQMVHTFGEGNAQRWHLSLANCTVSWFCSLVDNIVSVNASPSNKTTLFKENIAIYIGWSIKELSVAVLKKDSHKVFKFE